MTFQTPDPRDLDTGSIAEELSEMALPMLKATRFPGDLVFELVEQARRELDPIREAVVALSDRLDELGG